MAAYSANLVGKSKNSEKPIEQKEVDIKLSFRQAVLIEVLNPKTALFFLAFLPQFVQHNGYPVSIQLLTLGSTFALIGILYTFVLVLLSNAIGKKLFSKKSKDSKWMGKVIGLV
ncbi:LysE family translocator [Paenibacillus castaneae]|uniref:LysE family translocator n=1 Tax=Paenibacillus castaneae TaxID=474957 RepID=UPI001FBBC6C8|nr:LysE family transporter [Paenibacillus castaneae]